MRARLEAPGCPRCLRLLDTVAPERPLDDDRGPDLGALQLVGTCPLCGTAVPEPSWAWLPFPLPLYGVARPDLGDAS